MPLPALPRTPQHPPIQGARLALCSSPRARVRSPRSPPRPRSRLRPSPARSPAAAYQGCKTYWKSCRCKSSASHPCQELELQSQEGSRLRARRPSPLTITQPPKSSPMFHRGRRTRAALRDPHGRAGGGQCRQIPGWLPQTSAHSLWMGQYGVDPDSLAPSQNLPAPGSAEVPRVRAVTRHRWDLPPPHTR